MTSPLPEPWNDAWIDDLAQFDEALRLGRPRQGTGCADPQFQQAQDFLERLQGIWPRTPRKIGPYTLVSSLGQGAIGPSYLVEQPGTLTPFVLKVLWPDLSAHAETRQQFVADARGIQRLQDAGIASVREVIDRGALCIVVIDYCPGLSLAQWQRQYPQPVAWEIAGGLIMRLARILAVAHVQGISHGDLKPSNIFLSRADADLAAITPARLGEAELRLADFALAKAVQQTRLQSQGGLPWPMPQYLAPEQLQHRTRPAEPATDVYALGILWYDLLTGRCPVKGTTRAEILEQTRRVAPPPPRQYRPEIPETVEALVLRCLHKDPRERPAAGQDLADLVRAQLPEPKKAAPAWWRRWLRWK